MPSHSGSFKARTKVEGDGMTNVPLSEWSFRSPTWKREIGNVRERKRNRTTELQEMFFLKAPGQAPVKPIFHPGTSLSTRNRPVTQLFSKDSRK